MSEPFSYDVFVCYSSKDKAVVLDVAKRLKKDGVRVWLDDWEIRPGDHVQAKIEEGLENSRVLILCMSASAFSSDWAQLESGTFRFRDPLNKERRFIPLRLDEAPIKGSLAQFQCVNWGESVRSQDDPLEYPRLLEACRPPASTLTAGVQAVPRQAVPRQVAERTTQLDDPIIFAYAFSPDGKRALSGGEEGGLRLWDIETGRCLREFKGHTGYVLSVAWSADQLHALSGGEDMTFRLWDTETGVCLRMMEGHNAGVTSVVWSADQRRALSGSYDATVRFWDVETGKCLRVQEGHSKPVWSVALSADQTRALSGGVDQTVRLWALDTGQCLRVLEGHTDFVKGLAWSPDQNFVLSASHDQTLRLWDVATGRCLRVFSGHTTWVTTVAWSAEGRHALSGAGDGTVRLWDVNSGQCLTTLQSGAHTIWGLAWSADQRRAFAGDSNGGIRVWDLSSFVTGARAAKFPIPVLPPTPDQVQCTNAKVLLVGDTSSGKTGLAHRLATGEWKPSDGSTVGAWSTQWKLPEATETPGLDPEIWLWDFGGQADQRLVHQLYMDRTALVVLLFDADKEDVLPGLRDWQTALRRSVPPRTPQLLVAGRVDAGFKASRAKLQSFAREQGFGYYETSAKEGVGCPQLIRAIGDAIPWATMERRTSPRIFKLIRDEILALRDEGPVLHTFKELRELLWQRLHEEPRFTDETLRTVIGLLDAPGAVKELDYGTYILLRPEWINAYAQAVLRTLRQEPSELGCLPLRSIAEGRLLFQTVARDGGIEEMKRLPAAEERVVLREMERQLEERGLCLRQGDKLVFPSHCGRDRPAVVTHPSVFVSYAVEGYLDDIYATLVVKLAGSESFKLHELWRDAADFETLRGDRSMGVKLTRESAGSGDIGIYFAPGVTSQEQVIFANYIHAHLETGSEKVQRLRYYVCPHCAAPKGNPQVLMQKLLDRKQFATVECDSCEKRFDLWDDLEKRFSSPAVRERVEGLQASDVIRLDTRRKGKLLALEVSARITSADQKCFEIPANEDEGLDIELEFTDDEGSGTGKGLYLQLKSGNSHLRTRKKDGVEIFDIREQRWVDYWLKQRDPVMLVIGTFTKDDERMGSKDKLEFAEVRWMEISSVLRRDSRNGELPVKQIEFKGERLDLTSVHRWRDKVLRQTLA